MEHFATQPVIPGSAVISALVLRIENEYGSPGRIFSSGGRGGRRKSSSHSHSRSSRVACLRRRFFRTWCWFRLGILAITSTRKAHRANSSTISDERDRAKLAALRNAAEAPGRRLQQPNGLRPPWLKWLFALRTVKLALEFAGVMYGVRLGRRVLREENLRVLWHLISRPAPLCSGSHSK